MKPVPFESSQLADHSGVVFVAVAVVVAIAGALVAEAGNIGTAVVPFEISTGVQRFSLYHIEICLGNQQASTVS